MSLNNKNGIDKLKIRSKRTSNNPKLLKTHTSLGSILPKKTLPLPFFPPHQIKLIVSLNYKNGNGKFKIRSKNTSNKLKLLKLTHHSANPSKQDPSLCLSSHHHQIILLLIHFFFFLVANIVSCTLLITLLPPSLFLLLNST